MIPPRLTTSLRVNGRTKPNGNCPTKMSLLLFACVGAKSRCPKTRSGLKASQIRRHISPFSSHSHRCHHPKIFIATGTRRPVLFLVWFDQERESAAVGDDASFLCYEVHIHGYAANRCTASGGLQRLRFQWRWRRKSHTASLKSADPSTRNVFSAERTNGVKR